MRCDCLQDGTQPGTDTHNANETGLESFGRAAGNLSTKSDYTPFAFPSQLDFGYFKIGKHMTTNYFDIYVNKPNEIWFSLLHITIGRCGDAEFFSARHHDRHELHCSVLLAGQAWTVGGAE